MSTPKPRTIDTPHGPARAYVERPPRATPARGSVVVSHGAGGGIDAADLVALRALVDDGWTYVRVEQPWRVAGRKVATPPKTLDAAWIPIIAALREGRWAIPGPLVTGGRSAGARVACRTAAEVGADAVLALSFPLHPPGKPDKSRAFEAQEVLQAGLPLCVIQGRRDPFGDPGEVRAALGPAPTIAPVTGDHSLARGADEVLAAARDWLATIS
ncbi:alpha/beta family hydrolase [Flexivirga meconopsidis]|uniref:alpha/beta hydrolase family protein n=1 Tax=Flexivirga meconopsidis TaxID=2977121 RepID=UPI00223F5407|nr:alpha/beta family hydrolase [Flexivirga meconopsidis]